MKIKKMRIIKYHPLGAPAGMCGMILLLGIVGLNKDLVMENGDTGMVEDGDPGVDGEEESALHGGRR